MQNTTTQTAETDPALSEMATLRVTVQVLLRRKLLRSPLSFLPVVLRIVRASFKAASPRTLRARGAEIFSRRSYVAYFLEKFSSPLPKGCRPFRLAQLAVLRQQAKNKKG